MWNRKKVGHNHLIRFILRPVGFGYCITSNPMPVKKGGNRVKREIAVHSPLDYNTLIMFHRQRFLRVSAWLLAAAVLVPVSFAQTKRPPNPGASDGWRTNARQPPPNDGELLFIRPF